MGCVDKNEELVWRLCTSRNAPEFRLTNDHALKFKAWTSNYYDANPDDYHYNDHHLKDSHGDHEHIKYEHDVDHQHDDCDKDCDTADHVEKWHGSRKLDEEFEEGARKHNDDDDDDDDDDHK